MGRSTILMAMFNSFLYVYQRLSRYRRANGGWRRQKSQDMSGYVRICQDMSTMVIQEPRNWLRTCWCQPWIRGKPATSDWFPKIGRSMRISYWTSVTGSDLTWVIHVKPSKLEFGGFSKPSESFSIGHFKGEAHGGFQGPFWQTKITFGWKIPA